MEEEENDSGVPSTFLELLEENLDNTVSDDSDDVEDDSAGIPFGLSPPSPNTENLDEYVDTILTENIRSSESSPDESPNLTDPKVCSVICNIKVCALNLKHIAMRTRNSEYNPRRFPGLVLRLNDPKTTNLLFPSGRIVCVGSKSESKGRLGLRKVVKILNKLDVDARFSEFRVQNIIANAAVGFPIRLEGLAYGHSKFCHYEPEVFAGLVYRLRIPKVCLLIFVSGRIVFTGAKSENEIKEAWQNIYPILMDYRK